MRLGPEKLQAISTLLSDWSAKLEVSLKDLRSLAGKLLNITKIVPQSRPFLSKILNLLRGPSGNSSKSLVALDEEMKSDIKWWTTFLPFCNGIRIIRHLNYGPVDGDFSFDASPLGAGAFFPTQNIYISTPFPDWILSLTAAKDGRTSMNSLEMFAVMLTLRKWGHLLAGGCYAISSNNMSTIHSLASGKSQAPFRQQCLRVVALTCCRFDIHLQSVSYFGN
jgi:hypothetical protein